MAKVKKNLKHERFENSNFNISYDINYDKKTVSCMLDPKQEFINSLSHKANYVFKDNDNFDMVANLIKHGICLAWVEDDSEGEFKVDVCKAKAYYMAVEMFNNTWHNDTLKMQKLIASKVLDASRVYTSYSSIMLKRAKDRLEKKIAEADKAEADIVEDNIVEDNITVNYKIPEDTAVEDSDNNPVTEKLKNAAKLCKKLFTK